VPKPLVAIVVPVHNEKDNLERFHQEVSAVMTSLAEYDWEFVFVDDGSSDGSFEIVRALRERDVRVTGLRFPRNFGSHVAIAAGIDCAEGDAAVIMAATTVMGTPKAKR